ncbi:hypothetical protein [Bacteroides ovatus]|uniref:hypothetical protein n=1 Tax=Bacteroides ovatus TaxID=28116 RepID=UPI0022E0648E|nr:hypothetical protein [Bacteroides ovatus]
MIKATVICGGSAVYRYDETGKVPSRKYLNDHGGVVDVKTFNTPGEYDAYSMGLADADGWEETALTDKEFTTKKDKSTDCKLCNTWRDIFRDRSRDVYCPDCGKLIIHPDDANQVASDTAL